MQDISQLSIISIFGKENLENIQQKISKATGLAFVTVDYKGEPVTELTSFTSFCRSVRKEQAAELLCKSSDAFGAIQAAVTQKPFVYFCPCGLLEVAIPIIIKGQYLGGFIGGQMQCFDAPKNISDLRTILRHNTDYKNIEEYKNLYDKISTMQYQQYVDFAELVYLIIQQLGEKEMSKLDQKEHLNNKIDILEEQRKRIEIENSLKNAELIALRAKVNPQFLLRSLNTISNIAVIEGSTKTDEIISLVAEFFKHTLFQTQSLISIKEEMANIERYLKIQKVRLEDKLNYSINISRYLMNVKIPSLTVLPFVEKAVFYGISRKKDGGDVWVNVKEEKNYVVIEIFDNGMIYSKFKETPNYKKYKDIYEDESIEAGVFTARQIMISYFGRNFDVVCEETKQENKSILKYPKNFSKGSI